MPLVISFIKIQIKGLIFFSIIRLRSQNKYRFKYELSLVLSKWLYPGELELSYKDVYISLSVQLRQRLWPNHTVQTSNMQYAFGVQVQGEVLYFKFNEQCIVMPESAHPLEN